MTEFTVPPFTLTFDGRWVEIDLHGDLNQWARQAAREVMSRWEASGRRQEKQLTALFCAAGSVARQAQDATSAFLLYPALGATMPGMVRICPADLGGNDEPRAWSAIVEDLFPPGAWGDNPPEVTEIPSPAGLCRRFRQRFIRDASTGTEGEHLFYIWVFEQYGAGIILAPSFASPEEADTWRPTLDELAATAGLDTSVTALPGSIRVGSR